MIRTATLLLFLAVTAFAVATPAPEPHIDLYHHDSLLAEEGYHEVFRVTATTPGIHTAQLDVHIDGEPINATWSRDGELRIGDTLGFDLISFDVQRELEIYGDQRLTRHVFGGGAGTPL